MTTAAVDTEMNTSSFSVIETEASTNQKVQSTPEKPLNIGENSGDYSDSDESIEAVPEEAHKMRESCCSAKELLNLPVEEIQWRFLSKTLNQGRKTLECAYAQKEILERLVKPKEDTNLEPALESEGVDQKDFETHLKTQQSSRDGKTLKPEVIQTFIRDYYRSLNSVSTYIILACLLSFAAAFLFLSLYSAQVFNQDMQLLHLEKEKTTRIELESRNARENLISERYEEARECRSTLYEVYTAKEHGIKKIESRLQEANELVLNLKKELEAKGKDIEILRDRNTELEKMIDILTKTIENLRRPNKNNHSGFNPFRFLNPFMWWSAKN